MKRIIVFEEEEWKEFKDEVVHRIYDGLQKKEVQDYIYFLDGELKWLSGAARGFFKNVLDEVEEKQRTRGEK